MTHDTTTTTDETYRTPEPLTAETYEFYARIAADAATSGLYRADGDTRATKEQCLMVLLYGHDLGISPSAALQGINVFGDSMELSAGLLAGLIDRHPIYSYDAVACTDTLCTITLQRHGAPFKTVSFGIADAQRAQLLGSSYYQQFPDAMLFARCMSKLVRRHCPGVTSGIPVYVQGETRAGLNALDAITTQAAQQPAPGAPKPAADAGAQTPPADGEIVSQEQIDMLIAAAASAGLKAHQLYNAIAGLRGAHEPDEAEAKRKLWVLWSRLPASYVDEIIAAIAEGPDAPRRPAQATPEREDASAGPPAPEPAGDEPLPGGELVSDGDIVQLRAEAAEHQITDGQLVNVILRVSGLREHEDLAHAAGLLEGVLRALPLRYLPAAFRTLQEMSAAATPQEHLGAPGAGTVRLGVRDMDPHEANGAANGSGER